MGSRLFYIFYSLVSVFLMLAVGGVLPPVLSFPFGALICVILFLYIRNEFKGVRSSTLFYLNIAVVAMLLGSFFFQRVYPTYNFFLGILFFVVANLSYTKLFYKYSQIKIKPLIPFYLIAFMVVITIFLLLYTHFGYFYGLGIVSLFVMLNCLQAAYLRNGRVPPKSFRLVFYGMLLFFIIQVFSAFDHLELNLRWLNVVIIAGFLISQVMMIRGLKLEIAVNE